MKTRPRCKPVTVSVIVRLDTRVLCVVRLVVRMPCTVKELVRFIEETTIDDMVVLPFASYTNVLIVLLFR